MNVVHWFYRGKCYDGLQFRNKVLWRGAFYDIDQDGNINFRGELCRLYSGDCEE